MCSNLQKEQRGRKTYREGILIGDVERFENWAQKMPQRMKDNDKVEQNFWIVPVRFCTKQFLNNSWFQPEERTPLQVQQSLLQQHNSVFPPTMSPRSGNESMDYTMMAVK